jgi:DNA ligase 1
MIKQPMLAYSKVPALDTINYPVFVSPKLDGIRCVMLNGIPHTFNRKNKVWNKVPNEFVCQELSKLALPTFDGELMVNGGFNKVQSSIMSAKGACDFTYNVFDIIAEAPFSKRIEQVTSIIRTIQSPRISVVDQYWVENSTQLLSLWDSFIAKGYEGAMVRSLLGPYKFGRSTLKEGYLMKLKQFFESEAIIVDYKELMHNADTTTNKQENMFGGNTLGALVMDWKGEEFDLGSGFNQEQRDKIWANKESLLGSTVTFKYQEVTKDNKPRFPVFKSFREGY